MALVVGDARFVKGVEIDDLPVDGYGLLLYDQTLDICRWVAVTSEDIEDILLAMGAETEEGGGYLFDCGGFV
jgi:hypothetical protein